MAQVATAAPPLNIGGILKEPASPSSLPGSPTEILSSWIAPEIPKTFKASFAAWLKTGDGGASAELHLYKRSGFFTGASLNNANNADIQIAFEEASQKKASGSMTPHLDPNTRATVGTQLNANGKVGSIRKVDIGNPGPASWFTNATPRLINMLEIGTPINSPPKDEEKVVLLHGYGAGTSFFFQNIAALGKRQNSRLYALDWLGMGRSARVPFHIAHQDTKETSTRVEAAESFFVQALEEWRQKMNVEKMTLVAHSLGGYLSIAYSLKHPDRVSRLVLVSPAGIPEVPSEGSTFSPKPNGKTVEAELTQPQEDHVPGSQLQAEKDAQKMKNIPSKQSTPLKASEAERSGNTPPRFGSKTRAVFSYLWEKNASPFGLVRGSLFFGPMLVGRYTSRRFGSLPEEELRALHNYCQAIFTARGSSEYCLAHLLAPGAYARLPMVSRVSALPKTLPISYLYGSQDWMDVKGGRESVKRLAEGGNHLGSSFVVDNSGHHIYLDNPKAFDLLLKRILDGQVDGISR